MLLLLLCWSMQTGGDITFVDVTDASGLIAVHGYDDSNPSEPRKFSGGAAVGDVDRDGWPDVYVLTGEGGGQLFRNLGNGTFVDVTAEAGLAMPDLRGCGPAFVDVDGDFDLDLFVGGLEGTGPRLMRNRGDGSFEPFPNRGGFAQSRDTVAAAFADLDGDGDLDAFLSHWSREVAGAAHHVWENDGFGRFKDISDRFALEHYSEEDFSFAPSFADFDNNGQLDLLVSGDFGTSKILLAPDFRVDDRTTLTDEHGMGSAIGDVDNDGDLDWFVTSIWDPQPGQPRGWTGNRFYRNNGDGTFVDNTTTALRRGYWGWGAAFADFDNDGWLDLIHTNGWFGELADDFLDDPSRFFLNDGAGGLLDRTNAVGLDDRGQGRGVICFDYDNDGDQDLFVVNGFGRSTLYRNDGGNTKRWLKVAVEANAPVTYGSGYRVYVEANGTTQMRELLPGSNFASHAPNIAHFGLGEAQSARVRVVWRDHADERREMVFEEVLSNQIFKVTDASRRQADDVPWEMILPVSPAVTPRSEIVVISSGDQPTPLTITGYDANGAVTETADWNLTLFGAHRRTVLPGLPFGDGRTTWLKLSSLMPFAAAMTAYGGDRAFAIPAVRALSEQLLVPHVAAATEDFFTTTQVTNGEHDQVEIALDWAGAPSLSFGEVPPSGHIAFELNPSVSSLPDSWQGYAAFRATRNNELVPGSLAGSELFGYVNEARLAGLTLSGFTSHRLVFAHIADPSRNWWTGITVVNPGSTAANVNWRAFGADGTIVATGTRVFASGEKIAALIDGNAQGDRLFTGGLPPNAAWVQLDSDQPLAGYELFGSLSGDLFAGLQAFTNLSTYAFFPEAGNPEDYAALALVNGTSVPQDLYIEVVSLAGVIVDVASVSLDAFSRKTLLLEDLFKNTGARNYLTINAPRGIYAFQLIGDRAGTWLTGLNALPAPLVAEGKIIEFIATD